MDNQSVQSVTPPPNTEEPKYKKPSAPIVILSVFVVLLLLATVIFAILLFTKPDSSDETNKAANSDSSQKSSDDDSTKDDATTGDIECTDDPSRSDASDCSAAPVPTEEELLTALANTGESVGNEAVNISSNVKNSPISPYQIVVAGIGSTDESIGAGYSAMFYRVGPNDPWQFGFATQEAPSCKDFNGKIEQQKAFANVACYDNNYVSSANDGITTVGKYFSLL